MPTVDAHHHLWRFNENDFDWLTGPLAPLRRDFLAPDITAAMQTAGIDMAIAVQAQQTVEETRWLLDVAAETPEIAGVVGWLPLVSPDLPQFLDTMANPLLKGIRHMLQQEPDPEFMLREDFNRGLACLQHNRLVYDILVYERHLPLVRALVDRHPHQTFVLDHCGKPRIADQRLEPWRTHLQELARRPNVYCKVSGLVTEANPLQWQPAQLEPYLSAVVEAFGPMRLLAGSDWPVCLAGVEYSRWFLLLKAFFASYTSHEQAAIFGETATSVYSLSARS